MPKRSSLLGPAIAASSRADPELETAVEPAAVAPAPIPARAGGKRPGKYHLGAYFDPADPVAEAFRVLSARTRRSHQDLLAEAIAELVAKYDADKQFGRA